MFARELFNYSRRPQFVEGSPTTLKNKIDEILFAYFIYLGLALLSFGFIQLVDKITLYFYDYSISAHHKPLDQLKASLGRYAWVIIVLVGPLFEEILFRLPLNLKKAGLGLCLALVTYRLIVPHFFDFTGSINYLGIGGAFGVFILTALFFPSKILVAIKGKYFVYLFYASAITFALVHISNFSPLYGPLFLVYPLYTLPQFFMGLCLGYIRMKHGFFSGWALHALNNLPAALF